MSAGLPGQNTNLTGWHCHTIDDLGLSATLAASATDTSVELLVPVPMSVYVMAQLTSGNATVLVDKYATAGGATFGSPDKTITLTDTTAKWVRLDTDATNRYVQIKQVDNPDVADGTVFAELDVFVIGVLTPGETGYLLAGDNAVSSTRGDSDGSGVVPDSLVTQL